MTMNEQKVLQTLPIHYYVWKDDNGRLDEILSQRKYDTEQKDANGRTALMLAVKLNREACVNTLISYDAAVFDVYRSHWSLEQEAVSTANYRLIRSVLAKHDTQNKAHFTKTVLNLFESLSEMADLFFEIKLDFNTWLPIITTIYPSDICRIWKKGDKLRIDMNLVGFKGTTPYIRGKMCYVIEKKSCNTVCFYEINHSTQSIYQHNLAMSSTKGANSAPGGSNYDDSHELATLVSKRLSLPNFVTYVENESIAFAKSKSGHFVWSSEKREQINKCNCKVFQAKDIQLATMKRSEHIQLEGKKEESANMFNPQNLSLEDYFSGGRRGTNPTGHDIGRCKSILIKVKTFKSSLWTCEEVPVHLSKQILAIVQLLSEMNPLFGKINYFLQSKLPDGFPIKLEIPLYLTLFGSINFGNFYGEEGNVKGVTYQPDFSNSSDSSGSANKSLLGASGGVSQKCNIEESVFDIPKSYVCKKEDSLSHYGCVSEQDLDLQLAMMQTMEEYGRADQLVNRAFSLTNHKVSEKTDSEVVDEDEAMMQDVIAASLASASSTSGGDLPQDLSEEDKQRVIKAREQLEAEELARALELSKLVH